MRGSPSPQHRVEAGGIRRVYWLADVLVTMARAGGSPIEFVHAHRQSSEDRRSDPGEAIWRGVVEEYGIPVLGLKAEYALALPSSNPKNGPGKPIPVEWAAGGVGRY